MNLKIIIWIVFLLLIAFYFFKELWTIAHPKRVVLVSTRVKHVKSIFLKVVKDYVPDTEKFTFIEIGSGYSQMTRIAAHNFQWKSIEAVELRRSVVILARLRNFFDKYPIDFIVQDIFKHEILKNSVVYSYTSTNIMNKLYQMNRFEGCLVISL